MTLAIAFYIPF